MNAEDSLKLARRFIGLPLEKRQVFLQALQKEGVDFSRFPIPAGVEVEDRQALSYAQQRMWFLWQLDPASGAYNLPGAVRLKGALNLSAMEQAFASLVARHETLRTVFQRQPDERLLQVAVVPSLAVEQLDFSALASAEREQAVNEAATRQSLLPFDLEHGPLLRVQLLKLDEQEHVLLLTLHHIVSDGWSMNVLIDEFIRCYDAHERKEAPQLPALPIQYSDYALWQRRWLEAGEQARQLEYWQARLGDEHPVLELPTDRPRPAMPSYQGTRHNFAIDPALAAQLRSCAQKHNVTLFMLLLGAFNVLLHRYTGQGDIRIGVPIANRNRSEVEGLIGFFVNTQVLRTELTGQTRIAELLHGIKEHALGAQAHQELPFERLVEALKVERSLSHTPLFQVMYNHQPVVADIASVSTASGLELALVEWQGRTTQFDLTLDTFEKSGTLHAALTYANDLFDAPSIERMAQHWISLLQAMVVDGEQRVGELPMLDAGEQHVLIHAWNQTAESYPTERGIHHLIEAQVQRTPDAPALVFGSTTLSYAQLDARANPLAHALRERGVGPDVLVGICVERSIEMVVGLLAILKAGGAYVPLDPEYPQDRLAYMIEDSGITLLLSQQSLLSLLPTEGIQVITLDTPTQWLDGYSNQSPVDDTQALNLAYVIYTSGSTGKPKGAGNSHRALVNRLCWMQQAYGLDASDAVLQKTPFSFDVSVWEFFWPLMTGARLVVAAPGEHREPARLIETIGRHAITTLHFVPSMLQAFIHEPGVQACASLKRIVCSGEALPLDAQLQVFAKLPKAGLYNLYGPTEAAIDVTHWTCVDEGADSVPIGRPIANLGTYVLDAQLNPVPSGVSGELYLGGVGLARSYHRRPALTAERFVPSPFVDGERLYRTGDRVRQRADGVIEYLGRLDHQVKLRGLRIELGEIETRLMQHPTVREAVVLVQGGKQLVAYLVLENEEPVDLKAWLLSSLPEYMVPTHFISLAKLPVTANGKLDRKALPLPDAAPQQAFVAPQNPLQKALAAVWSDVLGVEQVGLDDNFFELGGDSIISIQVVSRARQAGIRLSPRDLFQYQSVRSLALVATVEQASVIDQGPVSGEVILTPVQASFFEAAIPARHHWNQSLLLSPREPLEPVRLEAALTQLINHHDALRLRFVQQADGWQQAHAVPVTEPSLWQSHASDDTQLAALCDEAQRSLDLAQGPLLRAALVTMADGTQRLLLVVHHLVVDGVSWRILLEDLQQAYRQAPLPSKTSAYQHWAQQLQAHAQTLNAQLPYWQAQSVDAELQCDHSEGSLQNRFGKKLEVRLGAEQTRRLLQAAPAAYRTQVNDLLLTALARVVCRWSGQPSALIQLEGHGREDLFDALDLTRTVGWFTSLFPVRLQGDGALSESIKTVKEQLRAVPEKGMGYGLLRYLGEPSARAALAGLPVPRITFNYLGQFDRQFDESALFTPASQGSGQAQDLEAPLANWLTVEGQVYGGELALSWGFSSAMFDTSTVQSLADQFATELNAVIEHCCAQVAPHATPSDFPLAQVTQAQLDALPVPCGQLDDLYPLSPMQQGLLFHTLYEQAAGEYINQLRVDVQGLDPERFRAAWQASVDAQDILRSGFIWQGELAQPLQIVHKQAQLPFTVFDYRDRNEQRQALTALADAEREQGFDLMQAPLLRLVLVRMGADQWHLIYTHHHILMDGWSNSQLLGEVLQRYSGGTPARAGGRYRDYIAWLQRQDGQLSQDFWRAQLAPLQAPTRLARVASGHDGERGHGDHFQTLDANATHTLETFARQQKVTVNTLVQAAWLLLLQRYTGQETVAFGATVAGRPADLPGIEQQVGLFINTLPVIGTPRPDQSVSSWLQAVQAQNLSLRDFEHTPMADIQRWAGQGGEALFDNILVFENYPVAQALQQPGLELMFGEVGNLEQTHYALSVAVTLGQQLTLHYSFDRTQFASDTVADISAHLLHVLEQFAQSAERNLGEIALANAHEQARQQALNQPQPYPVDVAVHQRIAALALARPQRTAVIFNDQAFSYGEIDQRANQLAHALIARGVGAETRVGVALPRSEAVIVALLAVLKAGGAYVPLDTRYPRERLAYLIEDSGLALLLSDSSVSAQLPVGDAVPVLELDRLDLNEQPRVAPHILLDPHNLAYVIYTSGSTGNPKGVSVAHGPLAMHCQAIGERYEMRDSDCEFHFMSFAFDGAHERWLTSLTHGASLLIRDDSLWTPEQTYNAMRKHGVTVVAFPPVYLQQLAEHAEREGHPPKVRIYCFGGDAVPNASFERVKRALDPDYIINGYGPTETVVTPLIWKAGRDVPCGAAYAPIGSRIGDRSAYVLDADLNLLPQGMAGELYLGGSGLARGYLARPGLTAERFVADPLGGSGGLLYRTGDLVRQRADGTFDYLDRIDNQVKIRGFRIELGEVEAALQALDGVREAVVVAQEGSAGSGKRLVAYVVGDVPDAGFTEYLREQLKASLPAHMVPAYVLRLERMPLTPNGKLDRKSLPKPDVSQLQQAYVAPRTELEQQLASIWQDVLKLEKVGVSDNFFELGGDSIISIQVVSRARQAGIRLTPKDLFQHQSIQALAGVVRTDAPVQLIDQQPVVGNMALLAIHQAFFAQDIPDRHHWNQSVMLKPNGVLDAQLLEQALQALLVHHDSLRLGFSEQAGGWSAQYGDLAAPGAPALVWQADIADAAALQALGNRAQRSLQLSEGPLVRGVLANLADGSQRLLLIVHHLVVDGVSWRILFDDLQAAYRQLLAGQAIELPAKTSAVKAWAEALQGYATRSPLQAEVGFWQQQLQGASPVLPCDRPEGEQRYCQARSIRSQLDKTLTRALLQEAPAAYRTQVNDLLLTALARVMVRWTGDDSLLVQLEGHGREDLFDNIDLTRSVGWFTSLYPVQLTPQAELGACIKHIKEQLRAIPNKGIGFGALAQFGDEQVRQALQALPVPRLTFNYLGQFDGSFAAHDDALFAPASESGGEEVNLQGPLGSQLALDSKVFGGELDLNWTFSAEVFDEATIQRLADDYLRELTALITHCGDPVHRGVTPSDFPLARLSQAQLDALVPQTHALEDVYPLSPMQQGMLFHTLLAEGGGDYINQMRVDVEGLEPQRFRAAWQAVVDAHDILRSGFFWQGNLEQPVQVVQRQVEVPFRVLDWRAEADLEAALHALADEERAQGLDLTRAPLMRLLLVRTGADRYHLIYTNHHILMDGWSSAQLLGEVLQHYRGDTVARPVGRYRDYIAWLQGQDAALGEAFWRGQLRELDEPVRLAHAFARPAQVPAANLYAHHHLHLDGEQTQRLADFARESKVTVNTLVQAAWLLLLQRYTGKSCVAFGATVAGRPAELAGIEQQIGLFINTLPVIASPRSELSLEQWLHSVQAQNLALREFEHTALFDIQRWAGQGADALFDNILVFENYPISEALEKGSPQGLRFGAVGNLEQTNYPLTLLVGLGAELTVQFSYQCASFSQQAVEQIATHLKRLLLQMSSDATQSLGALTLLSASETQQQLLGWNDTGLPYPAESGIHALFEAQARLTPDAMALVFAEQSLTYAQLNAQANRLAHRLIAQGVQPDQRVGIALDRGVEMIVGLLAILKAGGAYVPLDPHYPVDRLAHMIEDSGLQLLLTQASLLGQLPLPAGVRTLLPTALHEPISAEQSANPQVSVDGDTLCYAIYTSGSTGKPKGVMVPHGALVNFVASMAHEPGIEARDRVLSLTTFSFDIFGLELYGALFSGAAVVLVDTQSAHDPQALLEIIEQQQVSVVQATPSTWRMLLDHPLAGHLAGRKCLCGGEALAEELAARLLSVAGEVWNLYGPTETTIWSAAYQLSADKRLPYLGRPIANTALYIVGEHFAPNPVGLIGELLIGGDGLARGYHERAALTAERFLPDPFGNGARLYRTGDLARYRADGVIEYIGRVDHQVKIRGFRIELGEIEACLLAQDSVREAVVVPQQGPGGMQLVAYLIAANGEAVLLQAAGTLRDELKTRLASLLPDYMMPVHWVLLDRFPLTPNGKLDRKALPLPDANQLLRAYVAPQGALEHSVALIWQDVLKLARVGREDNFFELGGHSLLATQATARLQMEQGAAVPLDLLFRTASLAEYAEQLAVHLTPHSSDDLSEMHDFLADLETL
ncbi:non-ribosomal peptide synthetase [Pseudomonas costantinii]|uniref:Non-ribosomal peptide synthase domain TIGR01720/amino acid adenylation domain-containing protein n=1 Tax=Pseudomonas costantinii TaxID=168469 RepID=A0A1S2UFV2_9PSED|nr:non-ribosomal peptide synthase/polyketide synthase [Pseudomonas costantinii]OIN45327.1 non-ribosomal peptide synthetase [Pseudomonas costantinii]SED37811.1 non-ribosomal peptide synthase domain TIGR01720/amino acid adenylation domain-containing protein [Pseudomonas costantinii]